MTGAAVGNVLGNFDQSGSFPPTTTQPIKPVAAASTQTVGSAPASSGGIPVAGGGGNKYDEYLRAHGETPQDGSAPPSQAPQVTPQAEATADVNKLYAMVVPREGSDPWSVSDKGAIGVGQVLPSTAIPYLFPDGHYDPSDPKVQAAAKQALLDPKINEMVSKAYLNTLNRRYGGDTEAVLVAYNAGPDKADKWLAAGKDPSVLPPETQHYIGEPLSQQWGKLTPQEQKLMDERSAATEQTINSLAVLAQRYAQEAETTPPGSDKREALIAKYRENLEQMQQEWRQKVASPPIEKPVDAWANFGSAATIVGLLGGLLSRQHITAGLNGAAAAMTAINDNNHEAFEKAYQTWKTQTDLGLQMIGMENQDIRSLLEDKRMAVDEKNARLQTLAAEMGFQKGIGGMRLDNIDAGMNFLAQREKAAQAAQAHADQIQFHHDQLRAADQRAELAHQDRVAAIAARGGSAASLSQFGDAPEGRSPNPNKPTAGSNIPQSIWAGATQLALTGHMPVLGNSAAGRAAIQSALPWVLAARGMTDADMTRQSVLFRGALSASGTLGTRLANLNVGLSELPHLGEQLLKASAETPRTQFMPFNRLIQAYETNRGDPQIIKLGAAMNSYMQAYARAINPTGVITDDIRSHVDHVMNQAMADGQIQSGVEQLYQESLAMKEGLLDAASMGGEMFPLPGEAPATPRGGGHALLSDLPSPAGYVEGSVAKDAAGHVVAKIVNGQWQAP